MGILDRAASWAAILLLTALLCAAACYTLQEMDSEEFRICREGQEARGHGLGREDSPYPNEWWSLYRRSLWLKGWEQADKRCGR